jgi:hypothetical protein
VEVIMNCEHNSEFIQMGDFLEAQWQCCDCGMSMTKAQLELFFQNRRIEAKLDHIVSELDKLRGRNPGPRPAVLHGLEADHG